MVQRVGSVNFQLDTGDIIDFFQLFLDRPMKSAIRRLLPRSVLRTYRKLLRVGEGFRNRHRPTEDVFTEIYTANTWGGEAGEFCSDGGDLELLLRDTRG